MRSRLGFFVVFFAPVLLLTGLMGLVNLGSLSSLRGNHQNDNAGLADDMHVIAEATYFNKEVANVQRLVEKAMEDGMAGRLDEANAYLIHTQVVDRLAVLERQLEDLTAHTQYIAVMQDESREAMADFRFYRDYLVMSTDIVAIDPREASRHAYQAASRYLAFSEHTHHITEQITERARLRAATSARESDDFFRNTVFAELTIIALLIVVWFFAARIITRRVAALAHTMHDLAAGSDNSVSLPQVEAISQQRHSIFHEMARSVLAFRTAVVSRRQVQRELEESEATLRRAQMVAHIGSWHLDIVAATLTWSAESYRIFGKEPGSSLTVDAFFASTHPDDYARVLNAWSAALEGTPYDIEHRILAGDETRWVRQRAEIERGSDGRALAAVGTVQDITDRKQATAALERREMIYGAIINQSPLGIMLLDMPALHFVEFNDAACNSLGYSRSEFAALRIHDVQATMPPAEVDAYARRIIRLGKAEFETAHRHKDGRILDFWVTIRVLRLDNHNYLSAVWTDITERKAADAELLRYQNRLQELVTERTVELAAAKEEAEAANRAKSAFLANMSHEIRTPMNAIIGLTHLIRQDATDKRQEGQLDKVGAAARHLLGIINDILDFSKIEAGKLTLEPTDFETERVVGNVCDLLLDRAEAKGLELVVDIAELPSHLHGDGLRLGQVLLNLASNAIKFTEKGHVLIRGRRLSAQGEELRLRFEVTDTGIGLDEEQRQRLFQPFEQADRSTSRKYGGTGLGLVISRRLVEMMHGKLGVDSTPGQGSTFWLEATFATSSHATAPRAGDAALRILVADDLAEAGQALASIVARHGIPVDTVAGWPAAGAALVAAETAGRPYSHAFLDDNLSGLQAETIGRQLADAGLQQPPSLILMGPGSDLPPDTLRRFGFARHLPKPFLPSAVDALLQPPQASPSLLPEPDATAFPSAETALQELVNRGRRRILLAEDNELNQEVALALLTHAGLEVDLAGDGTVAVALAEKHPYDLILMDIQMPDMDGLEASRRIRTLPSHTATPILAMTADAFDEDREACLAAGMNDHVGKPVDPEHLYETLVRWLPRGSEPSAPPTARAVGGPLGAALPATAEARLAAAGLDVAAGLRAVRGDMAHYQRLLEKFCSGQGEAMAGVDALLVAGDLAVAQRFAHTLKGLAGTLGIEDLRQQAAALEAALKQQAPGDVLRADAAALNAALTRRIAAIRAALPAAATAPAATARVDLASLAEPLHTLLKYLETDDLHAAELWRQWQPAMAAAFGTAAASLDRQIASFAYDAAITTVNQLLASVAAPPAVSEEPS